MWSALFPSYRITYWCIAIWSIVLIGKGIKLCCISRQTQHGFPSFPFWSQLRVIELMSLNKIIPPLEKEERLEFAICGDVSSHLTLAVTPHVHVKCDDPDSSFRRPCFACCCGSGYNWLKPVMNS